MLAEQQKPVLIVEDSEVDYEAIVWSLQQVGISNPTFRCEDGDEALDFVHHRGQFSDPGEAPRPLVILLDLNLITTSGFEVLQDVKGDDTLKSIPVIVFTTSKNPDDIRECYQLGANSYVQKPLGLDKFKEVFQRMKWFWFETVTFPDECDG